MLRPGTATRWTSVRRTPYLEGRTVPRPFVVTRDAGDAGPTTSSSLSGASVVLPIGDRRWAEYVDAHPDATPFHEPAWAALLGDCYSFRPFLVALLDREGGLRAGLPFLAVTKPWGHERWVALPFSDECGPLADGVEALAALQEELQDQRRTAGVGLVEVRGALPGPGSATAEVALTQRVALRQGSGAPRSAYRSTARRGVARSRANGVRVVRATRQEDLVHTWYRLHVVTRHRLGVPVQPRRYFDMLWERMLEPGHGWLDLALLGDDVVAGAVFLTGSGRVSYKYGASNGAARATGANFALFDEVLNRCAQDGMTVLDFGRTDLADTGLRRFKEGWGATTSPLSTTHLGEHPTYPTAKGVDPWVRAAVRRCPPVVCRLVGASLYRYVA